MQDQQIAIPESAGLPLIAKDIAYIQRDIADIRSSLKDAYATKDSVLDLTRIVEDLRKDMLKKSTGFSQWGGMVIAGVISAVMTFFVVGYFTAIHK